MARETDPLVHKNINPNEVLEVVSGKILRYVAEAGQFERMVHQYGTPKDTTEFRKQISAKRDELVHTYKIIAHDIKELKPSASGIVKVKLEKMTDQFERMHKEFQHFQEASIQNDRVYHPIFVEPRHHVVDEHAAQYTFTPGKNYSSNSNSHHHNQNNNIHYNNNTHQNYSQNNQNQNNQQYYQLQAQQENNVISHLVEERNKDMALVAKDMEDLKDVFVDLNKLAAEQGIVLNQVHTNTGQADVHVEAGVRELVKAKEYSSSYRKKLILLAIIIIIILAVLGVVLYMYLK